MKVTVRHTFESTGCEGERFRVSSEHTVDYNIRIEKPSDLTAVSDPYHHWLTLGRALYCDDSVLARAIFGLGVSVEAGGQIYDLYRLVTAESWGETQRRWLADEFDTQLGLWWGVAINELKEVQ